VSAFESPTQKRKLLKLKSLKRRRNPAGYKGGRRFHRLNKLHPPTSVLLSGVPKKGTHKKEKKKKFIRKKEPRSSVSGGGGGSAFGKIIHAVEEILSCGERQLKGGREKKKTDGRGS